MSETTTRSQTDDQLRVEALREAVRVTVGRDPESASIVELASAFYTFLKL